MRFEAVVLNRMEPGDVLLEQNGNGVITVRAERHMMRTVWRVKLNGGQWRNRSTARSVMHVVRELRDECLALA